MKVVYKNLPQDIQHAFIAASLLDRDLLNDEEVTTRCREGEAVDVTLTIEGREIPFEKFMQDMFNRHRWDFENAVADKARQILQDKFSGVVETMDALDRHADTIKEQLVKAELVPEYEFEK